MKKDVIFSKNRLKLFLFFIITFLKYNKTEEVLSNFQSVYLSDNKYYVISNENIFFYDGSTNTLSKSFAFSDGQKITTDEEAEMISLGGFKYTYDFLVANLLIVKNYIYAVEGTTTYCNSIINQIQGYQALVFPLECIDINCYCIIGIINSDKQLNLYLFRNVVGYCICNFITSLTIDDNVDSDNFSCQLIKSSVLYGKVLSCFYENNLKEIVVKILKIVLTSNNEKIESIIYGCLSKSSSLIFDYYDISDEYFLCCYKSDQKSMCLKL